MELTIKDVTTQTITFKQDKDSEERQIKVTMNWEGASAQDIQDWAMSNRIIVLQRQLRLLSEESLDELKGQVSVHVLNAGKKIQTQAEILADAKKAIAAMPAEVREALLKSLAV